MFRGFAPSGNPNLYRVPGALTPKTPVSWDANSHLFPFGQTLSAPQRQTFLPSARVGCRNWGVAP